MRNFIRRHFVYFPVGVVLILSSCALVEPEDANSSLLIGRAKAFGFQRYEVENALELIIANLSTGASYFARTDTEGYFFIPNVERGRYQVTNLVAKYSRGSSNWTSNWGKARESFFVSSGKISYLGYYVFDRLPAPGVNQFTPTITVSNQKRDIQKALEYLVIKFPDSTWSIMAKNELQKLR